MIELEKFVEQLDERKHITIAVIDQRKKNHFTYLIIVNLLIHCLLFFFFYNNLLIVSMLIVSSVVIFIVLKRRFSFYSSASLNGDTLILKNFKQEHSVTSIRSVKKITSKKFGKHIYTALQYKLDGKLRKAVLI